MKNNLKVFAICACCLSSFAISNKTMNLKAAEETTIEAFAHYEFKDAANPGKDSSKHGFDLKKQSTSGSAESFQILEEDGNNYLSIRRDQYPTGVSKGSGSYLYAPQLGNTSYDFSDMITGSYTVTMKFRADNTIGLGDVYALSFGRYGSCLTIVPWSNRIEIQLNNIEFAEGETREDKQAYVEANRSFYAYSTAEWTDVAVSADADTNKYSVYINSELVEEVVMPGVRLSSPNYDDYTFTLGAQSNVYGQSATQYGNADYKDVQIYDCALSGENVGRIAQGLNPIVEKQAEGTTYVSAIDQLDTSALDLDITDVNTVDELMKNVLPAKVKATLSNGVNRSYPVYWYPAANQTIKGYVQTGYLNADLKELEVKYQYAAKFDYDENAVTLTDIQLDGVDYVPGTAITPNKHLVTFKLDLAAGVELNGVSYFGMEWDVDDDGVYYIDIAEGALITIDATVKSFTITYMDGNEKISTSKYTQNGSEQVKTYGKDGYEFEGWYLDPEFTQKFTALDYANPSDITLYAHYVEAGAQGNTSEEVSTPNTSESTDNNGGTAKKGCKGSASGSLFGLLALSGALLLKRKSNKK